MMTLPGVTAAFNRNLLARLNRELDADFDLEAFAHLPLWNAAASRIEMHLVSRVAQTSTAGGAASGSGFCGRRNHPHGKQLQVPARPGGSAAGRSGIRASGNLDR